MSLTVSYPAISLTTANVGRHRHPQKRFQTATNLQSTRIRARTVASVTSSPPFQCPHAVHRWIRAKAKAGMIARKKKTSNLELMVFLNKCFKVILLLVDSDFPVRIDFSHSFLIR